MRLNFSARCVRLGKSPPLLWAGFTTCPLAMTGGLKSPHADPSPERKKIGGQSRIRPRFRTTNGHESTPMGKPGHLAMGPVSRSLLCVLCALCALCGDQSSFPRPPAASFDFTRRPLAGRRRCYTMTGTQAAFPRANCVQPILIRHVWRPAVIKEWAGRETRPQGRGRWIHHLQMVYGW